MNKINKEETIEWLNTNGKDFIGGTCEWISINSNEGREDVSDNYYLELITDETFIIRNRQYWEGRSVTEYYKEVSFKSILYQDVSTITIEVNKDCPEISYFVIKTEKTEPYKYWRISNGSKVEMSNNSTNLRINYYKDNEENAKRVLKAIMHLAKLSGAKENKQTF